MIYAYFARDLLLVSWAARSKDVEAQTNIPLDAIAGVMEEE